MLHILAYYTETGIYEFAHDMDMNNAEVITKDNFYIALSLATIDSIEWDIDVVRIFVA